MSAVDSSQHYLASDYSTEILRRVDDTARTLLLILGEDDLLEVLREEAEKEGGWTPELTLVGLRALKPHATWQEIEAA